MSIHITQTLRCIGSKKKKKFRTRMDWERFSSYVLLCRPSQVNVNFKEIPFRLMASVQWCGSALETLFHFMCRWPALSRKRWFFCVFTLKRLNPRKTMILPSYYLKSLSFIILKYLLWKDRGFRHFKLWNSGIHYKLRMDCFRFVLFFKWNIDCFLTLNLWIKFVLF